MDSQTIKTATHGQTTGYDACKKIKGRKCHLLVDTLGLLTQVQITAADVSDQDGLKDMLTRYRGLGVPDCGSRGLMAAIEGRNSKRGWPI